MPFRTASKVLSILNACRLRSSISMTATLSSTEWRTIHAATARGARSRPMVLSAKVTRVAVGYAAAMTRDHIIALADDSAVACWATAGWDNVRQSSTTVALMCLTSLCLANASVQLQAHYHHCDEVASEKCLSAATFVR